MIQSNNEPQIVRVCTDNGEHSHFRLIDVETGKTLWEEPEDELQQMDQSRVLDDVREILSQKINVYRVGRDWGFANAGIMSDGYWTKELAEIAARDAIIEAARAVAHVG